MPSCRCLDAFYSRKIPLLPLFKIGICDLLPIPVLYPVVLGDSGAPLEVVLVSHRLCFVFGLPLRRLRTRALARGAAPERGRGGALSTVFFFFLSSFYYCAILRFFFCFSWLFLSLICIFKKEAGKIFYGIWVCHIFFFLEVTSPFGIIGYCLSRFIFYPCRHLQTRGL